MSDHSLTPVQVAESLRVTPALLRSIVATLPPELLERRPAPGEWSIKEILGHLIIAEELGLVGRIRALMASDEPTLALWDQVAIARERNDDARDARELLDEFEVTRERNLSLVRSLQPADLERGGHHPEIGYVRVSDFMHEWVYHDQAHLQQILQIVQQNVWPYLGNTQRFYQ